MKSVVYIPVSLSSDDELMHSLSVGSSNGESKDLMAAVKQGRRATSPANESEEQKRRRRRERDRVEEEDENRHGYSDSSALTIPSKHINVALLEGHMSEYQCLFKDFLFVCFGI